MKYLLLAVVLLVVGCAPTYKAGVGYSRVLYEPDRLTGNDQFHIKFEAVQPINKNWSVNTGWHHYSNGSDLGIGREPNWGLDFFNVDIEYTFNP